MPTTAEDLDKLLVKVDAATKELQASATVPDIVVRLVDSFGPALHAEAPLGLQADPYLTTMLFAAAYRADKALRHANAKTRRTDVRVALEQFRHALRDIVAGRPFGADTPARQVLARTSTIVSMPQKDLADLLGVSTRQLQRWLAPDGSGPTGNDEARLRVVGQTVNQLRHTFTGPGVVAWFNRKHPSLGVAPVSLLDDPISYPAVLAAATGARAMSA